MDKIKCNMSPAILVSIIMLSAFIVYGQNSYADNSKTIVLPPAFGTYHSATGESYSLTKEELEKLTKKTAIGKRQGRFRNAQRNAKQGIFEKIEEQDIENKIYSVKFLPVTSLPNNGSKVKIKIDLQYNGKRGLAKFDYESEYFSDSNDRRYMFSDVAVKPGRQNLTAFITFYGGKRQRSMTNIKLQLKDAKDTVIIEKKLDEVIDWEVGKLASIRTNDKHGYNTAVRHAAVMIDNARRKSDYNRPKEILEKVLLKNPDFVKAYVEMARYHMSTNWGENGFRMAEKTLKQGLKIEKNNANLHVLLGYVYTWQNRFSEANHEYQLSEKLGTDNLWLYANWALMHIKKGEDKKAERVLNKLVEKPRDNTRNDRALAEGFRLYVRLLKSKRDFTKLGSVLKTRFEVFEDNACYGAEYGEYLGVIKRDFINAERITTKATQSRCRYSVNTKKALATVLLMKSLTNNYGNAADADRDLRRSQIVFDDSARIIADIAMRVVEGDFYQALERQDLLDQKGSKGISAITYCIQEGSELCVYNLLQHGANPNQIVNEDGFSLLMVAVLSGNTAIVKNLVHKGSARAYKTKTGVSARALAELVGKTELIKLLGEEPSI